jgi:hypothetical protein
MRYLILEEQYGIFLGILPTETKQLILFAKTDILGTTKAISFDTKEIAENFIEIFLNTATKQIIHEPKFDIIGIETKEKYVHIIDIIKEGYGKYCHMLLNNIELQGSLPN